ncbi:MAG: tRNA pseudouridine(38-40) synthase TruA [Candidatus Ranarchaeia archaeon]|jgi:tRNA pseudouridine38-40 synthase
MKEKSTRYALHLAYLGSGYKGSQRQPDVETIEGVLLEALRDSKQVIEDPQFNFKTCGRTDAGVHALDWVVAFSTPDPPVISWINSNLPKNIRIWGQAIVPDSFHPRFDALNRTYQYITVLPLSKFNLESLEAGIEVIRGKHDFGGFATPSPDTNSTTCDMQEASVRLSNETLVFSFTANRFLWHMVRKLVNSLLRLGTGTLTLSEFREYLNLSSLTTHPQIHLASPDGLVLTKVQYSYEVEPNEEGVRDTLDLFREVWIHSARKAKLAKVALETLKTRKSS